MHGGLAGRRAQEQQDGGGRGWEDVAQKWDECTRTWRSPRRQGDAEDDGGDSRPRAECVLKRQGLRWELLPILLTLRVFLMLPVSISKDGLIHFRWRSAPMAATFVAWLATATVGFFCIRFYLDPIRSDRHFHVRDLVPQYCNAFNIAYIFFLPYSSWATTSQAISMLEQWHRVEARVTVLRGSAPVPGLRARVWIYVFLSFLFPFTMCVVTLSLYSYEEVWMAPIVMHLFSFSMLAASFWNLTCRGLASVAILQATFLMEDFQRLGIRAIRDHRKVWLGMARVLELLTVCWGRTHALLLGMGFVSFVSLAFLVICMAVARDWDSRIIWLGPSLLYCFGITTSVCNSAQIATDAMRRPTTKQLLLLSLAHRDKDTLTEIWRFLHDISLTSPRITITGMTILSRATIISFLALANTYLFVVSQFAISVETTGTNFSEDPFLLMDGT